MYFVFLLLPFRRNLPHIGQIFPLDDIDTCREDLYDLAQVTGWEPYNLHDLVHVSRVGSTLYIEILRNISQRPIQDLLL